MFLHKQRYYASPRLDPSKDRLLLFTHSPPILPRKNRSIRLSISPLDHPLDPMVPPSSVFWRLDGLSSQSCSDCQKARAARRPVSLHGFLPRTITDLTYFPLSFAKPAGDYVHPPSPPYDINLEMSIASPPLKVVTPWPIYLVVKEREFLHFHVFEFLDFGTVCPFPLRSLVHGRRSHVVVAHGRTQNR